MKKYISILLVAFLFASCGQLKYNLFYAPLVKEDYQEQFSNYATIEKKYAYNGNFAIDSLSEKSNEKNIGRYHIWYPKEMRTSNKKYPVVVMANGTGVFAYRYVPIFEHLASWGFIVIGNEDPSTWYGNSTSTTLDHILALSKDKSSIFYNKIKANAIGLAGHSQGGVATFYAATEFDNSSVYKAICSMSGNNKDLASKIQAPILMIGGTGGIDAQAKKNMNDCYPLLNKKPVVMGVLKNTEHGVVLQRGDAYMTAWMCYWLKGDSQAGKCFVGSNPELMSNKAWSDTKKKNL